MSGTGAINITGTGAIANLTGGITTTGSLGSGTHTIGGGSNLILSGAGAVQIGGTANTITLSNSVGNTQLGTSLNFVGTSNLATLANISTTYLGVGTNVTVGNTMTAFIASTQQNIASSFFGNLADAQTVVVQSV